MSHVADIELRIRDLDALEAGVKKLGGVLHRGQTTHKWYGQYIPDLRDTRAAANRRDPATFGKCTHAIGFPGIKYEIGVCTEADGAFSLVYDSWGSYGEHDGEKLEAQCGGAGLPKIKDESAAAVATRLLARKGFRVTRTQDAKGAIVLKATN